MVYQKQIRDMINRLEMMGIRDKNVLSVMAKVPRHKFISEAFGFQAYDEKALPIGHGQTISHPYTVAKMTELLEVKSGDKILEIGTGSGYQTAVLTALKAQVFSIEIKNPLSEKAKKILSELGYQALLKIGDGRKGWKAYAPYHAIIVTAGAPVIPTELLNQLRIGGKLLIPVGSKEKQNLMLYIKGENETNIKVMEEFQFVPLLAGDKQDWKRREPDQRK
jgi:protein-L-isoaspartate(D-aspartate) O-methyltransferase